MTCMHRRATVEGRVHRLVDIEPDFDFTSEEYRALYRQSGASAFQAPMWQAMIHRRLAPSLKARQNTITVRDPSTGALQAVFPFVVQLSAGISVLQPADFGVCDRNDVVATGETLERLANDKNALRSLKEAASRHDLLLFRKVWEDGFDVRRLFEGAKLRPGPNGGHVCETGTDAAAWKREVLRKKFVKEMGRLQRQTEREQGAYVHRAITGEAEIRSAFEFLRKARQGRYGESLLDDPRFFSFYLAYAIAGARTGDAITYVSTIAGETVAVLFGLSGDGEYHAVLVGADISGHESQSTGIQLLLRVMEMRMADGHATFDMGLGDPGYKHTFRPREISVGNLTCSYSPTGSALAMIYHRSPHLKGVIKGFMPNVR